MTKMNSSFLVPIALSFVSVFYGCSVFRERSIATNEVSAIKQLQAIHAKEQFWYNKSHKYVPLDQLFGEDNTIPSPNSLTRGYRFNVRLKEDGKSYSALANPAKYNESGRRSFYMTEQGEIHCANRGGEDGTLTDPPIK